MLGMIPLLVIPFLLYNLGLAGIFGSGEEVLAEKLFSLAMMSGGVWTMTVGDALIALALVLLFVEAVKSTRTSPGAIADHLLSTFVFAAFLVEFLLVPGAAHSVFFTLMLIALVDVLAGFAVSIRSAARDINM